MGVPLEDMEKQGSSGLFHGLDHDAKFWGHRGIGLLQRVEVQDDIQDLIGDMGTSTDQSGKGIQSGINEDSIAIHVS